MTSAPLEDRTDALYALPLEQFVAERKRLGAELKKQGDAAGARALAARGKPTVSAWLTNQTVRRAPALVRDLFAATDAVAAAQATQGAPGESTRRVQAAVAEQRELVGRLAEVARAIVAEAGLKADAGVIDRVANNLRWGAIAGDQRAALERGHLVHDVASPGFAAFGGMTLNEPPPTAGAAAPVPAAIVTAAPRDAEAERRRAAEEARAAADVERERQRILAARHAALERARQDTVAARRALDRLEAARSAAEARVAAAETALGEARSAATAARDDCLRAAAALRAREDTEAAARAEGEAPPAAG